MYYLSVTYGDDDYNYAGSFYCRDYAQALQLLAEFDNPEQVHLEPVEYVTTDGCYNVDEGYDGFVQVFEIDISRVVHTCALP